MATMKMATAASVLLLASAGVASAATVNVDYRGNSGLSAFNVSINGTTRNANGGRFDLDITGASVDSPIQAGASLRTFCIEIFENVGDKNGVAVFQGSDIIGQNIPDDDNGVADPLGSAELTALSWLFNNHFATVNADTATDVQIEAFQLAVWEIVYERGDSNGPATYGLANDGGDFFVASSYAGNKGLAVALSDTWLGDLNSASLVGYGINEGLIALSKDGFQDQITLIPLPGAALMGLVGLGGAVAARRRMRQG